MSTARMQEGRPLEVVGGPEGRLLAQPTIPTIRRVFKATITAEIIDVWSEQVAYLERIDPPVGLKLPCDLIIDLGDIQHANWWLPPTFGGSGNGPYWFTRELLLTAARQVDPDVKPTELGPDGVRAAWQLLGRTRLQVEGEDVDLVTVIADALDEAFATLVDECGLVGDRDE
ncbi:MAG: hypothetical protein K6T28_10225 [Acidothermus sp.]|nr:hypothetical protein [Acidothermus sp.]